MILTSQNRVSGQKKGAGELWPILRRIPFDDDELNRELVQLALPHQPVHEGLHAFKQVSSVIIVAGGNDD
jgi:hypothetical protein